MKKKLFVGNLSWKVTEDVLRPLFEAYGTVVSVKVVLDRDTGRSKGFAFVEMETEEAAEQAMNELNNKAVMERNLRISFAQDKPREERRPYPSSGNGGGGGGGGGRPYNNRSSQSQYS